MAVQFNVACKATGHKITDITVEISNKTIDCEKQQALCGGLYFPLISNFFRDSRVMYLINFCGGDVVFGAKCPMNERENKQTNKQKTTVHF